MWWSPEPPAPASLSSVGPRARPLGANERSLSRRQSRAVRAVIDDPKGPVPGWFPGLRPGFDRLDATIDRH